VVVAICGYRTRTHITTLRKIAAIAAIPAALRCEAAGVANSVGNMRKITTVEQATAYILSVISAVAPIEVAFLVVALEITLTVANIINGTRTPSGRTAHVV
jgi:hypothetical protein